MKRLTNDNPQDNVSSALNLFYVKDGWTWVRGGGPGPDYADISLNDYVRMIARDHGLEIAKSSNDDEISCEMAELLFDGTSTVEGIVATLYTAGWAFAELRERLKRYEEMEAQDRSNDPLTLEELREMDGEPVWIDSPCIPNGGCYIILREFGITFEKWTSQKMFHCEDYGKTWLAYRRKPEER